MVVILLQSSRNFADEIKIIQEFCSEFCMTSILQSKKQTPNPDAINADFFQKNEFAEFKKTKKLSFLIKKKINS